MSTTRRDRCAAQGGFTTLAALFILVVLAGLGGYIASLNSSQSLSQLLDVMSSRAASAARAGIDLGTYQIAKAAVAPQFRTNCEAAGATFAGAAPATQVLAAGTLVGLESMRVEMECRSEAYDEAGTAYRVYQITATACNAAACPAAAPGLGYAEHRQVVRVRR